MNSKIDNQLATALELEEKVRENTFDLQTGYDPQADSWELIVKYNGHLEKLESPVIHVEPLINGYAIVTIREDFIDAFSELDEVEYIEKPKRLFFQ